MKSISRNILLTFMIKLVASHVESTLTDVVQTTKGPIQGEILKTVIDRQEYSSFKGIPYAEPPINDLRYKPPVEKKPWTEIRQTTVEGANCVQKDFVHQHSYTGLEDCLYLNVYTPETDLNNAKNNLHPVMVWIHGGTFKSGYGNSSLYGPDFIIEENVVLVTFNYRLGPLGFLSLNHEKATGNAGLKDQNLVLRWVKQNIIHFGGNPNNVTLVGQSAGGVAVDLHALSDLSNDLFHRSISMSASPLCPWAFHSPDVAETQAFKLGYELGLQQNSRDKNELLLLLHKADPVLLMQLTEKLGSSSPPFAPTVERVDVAPHEEKFLTECSYKKYQDGSFRKVPHLTGFTKHETLLFTGTMETFKGMLNSTFDYLSSLPSKSPISIPYLEAMVKKLANRIIDFTTTTLMGVIKETSNLLFVNGIDSKQKYLQQNNVHPIYYYCLSYQTDRSVHKLLYNISLDGVAHGDDFAYLFHMTVIDLPLKPEDPTFIVRKRLVKMWTNFAKHSNPTPEGKNDQLLQGITWPESGPSGVHLDIDKDMSIGGRPIGTSVKLYQVVNDALFPLLTGCSASSSSSSSNAFVAATTGMVTTVKNFLTNLFKSS